MSSTVNRLGDTQIIYSINGIAEKEGVHPDDLFSAIEYELAQEVGERQYGNARISVHIDRKTGEITVKKRSLIVEDEKFESIYEAFLQENEERRVQQGSQPIIMGFKSREYDDIISLSKALENHEKSKNNKNTLGARANLEADLKTELKAGQIIEEELPGIYSDYLIARSMKPRLERVVNSLIRTKQFNEYKARVNTIVVGVVKRAAEQRNGSKSIIVDLNGVEAFLPGSSLIKGEIFRAKEKIKAIIERVEFSLYKPQIILSRASNEFLTELFTQQVPEIYDGIVELKKVVRDSGSRAKVAVYSADKNIDPVGACIGIRGNRINAISAELNNEKIDIVEYSYDPAVFLVNAIKPIKASKVIVIDDEQKIELIVPDEQLSLLIGRRGQNIQLISQLLDWNIQLLGESVVSKKRMEDFVQGTNHLMEALNVEEVIAQLLVTEGFTEVTEVANSDITSLAYIEGFDVSIAQEIHRRANTYLEEQKEKNVALLEKYGINAEFLNFLDMEAGLAEIILEAEIKTWENIADLSQDELIDIVKDKLSEQKISALIIKARKKAGWL